LYYISVTSPLISIHTFCQLVQSEVNINHIMILLVLIANSYESVTNNIELWL